jgi:hypothetical protein
MSYWVLAMIIEGKINTAGNMLVVVYTYGGYAKVPTTDTKLQQTLVF